MKVTASMFQIRTDFDTGKGNIKYSLKGIGANEYPFNVFVVNEDTGEIRVTKILDREVIDTYNVRLIHMTILSCIVLLSILCCP